jgi:predicted nucleic acid-binding OB-fold protein
LHQETIPHPSDIVFVGKGERIRVEHVERRLEYGKLTKLAKMELPHAILKNVRECESRYVYFYNRIPAVSHLLPGKSNGYILKIYDEKRKHGPYKSFADIKARIKGLGNPDQLVAARIKKDIVTYLPWPIRVFIVICLK